MKFHFLCPYFWVLPGAFCPFGPRCLFEPIVSLTISQKESHSQQTIWFALTNYSDYHAQQVTHAHAMFVSDTWRFLLFKKVTFIFVQVQNTFQPKFSVHFRVLRTLFDFLTLHLFFTTHSLSEICIYIDNYRLHWIHIVRNVDNWIHIDWWCVSCTDTRIIILNMHIWTSCTLSHHRHLLRWTNLSLSEIWTRFFNLWNLRFHHIVTEWLDLCFFWLALFAHTEFAIQQFSDQLRFFCTISQPHNRVSQLFTNHLFIKILVIQMSGYCCFQGMICSFSLDTSTWTHARQNSLNCM